MFESNLDKVDLADANAFIKVQQNQIDALKNQFEFASQAVESWKRRFDKIKDALQEFANDEELDEGDPLGDYLIEEFGLELTKEVEVEITVKYSATMTIPKNADASDFTNDLEISDIEFSSNRAEMTGISCDDYEIREA